MIQANELRLGNYILHNGEVKSVKSIYYDETVGLSDSYAYNLLLISPIILTQGMLYNLGFIACSCGGWKMYDSANPNLNFHLEKDYTFNHSGPVLKHLHQLQNFYFYHIGHELKITL